MEAVQQFTLSSNSSNSNEQLNPLIRNLIILLKSYSKFPNCLNKEFLQSCIPVIKNLKSKAENETITENEKQLLETFIEFFEKDTLQEQERIILIAMYNRELEILKTL